MTGAKKSAAAAKKSTKKAAKKAAKASPKAAKAPARNGRAKPELVADAAGMRAMIKSLAMAIAKAQPDPTRLLVLGVRSRGVPLADRLRDELARLHGLAEVPGGVLDITLYRDDLSALGPQPMVRDSEISHDVTGADIILVDDVLYTGRTIRAALDEIVDFGRPARIRLAVLVDRGWREYPIQADFAACSIETREDQIVHVRLEEIDGVDEVLVVTREDAPAR